MALNKGEWSEVYTFLKLLADGKLYAADEKLNRIETIYYPILKILHQEPKEDLEFTRNSTIEIYDSTGNKQLSIPIDNFKNKAEELLKIIQKSKQRSFDAPKIESFMNSIKITKLKAHSKEKKDITLVVHDIMTGHNPTLGFSIKSKLGNASTLVNPGETTNFIYELSPSLPNKLVETINNIDNKSKIKSKITEIEKNSKLIYKDMQNINFKNNLMIIDSSLPIIISEMLKFFYAGFGNKIEELVKILNETNPCKYDISSDHPYYEYKIKKFLTDYALGMTPSSIWKGKYNASGGYIVVKEDGDIVCYHIYNLNEFQDYLYKNTKLDTPSSSRYKFGNIYQKNGKQYFKLNLQIRFI